MPTEPYAIDAVLNYLEEHFGQQPVKCVRSADSCKFELRTHGVKKTLVIESLALDRDYKSIYSLLRRTRVAEQLEQAERPVAIAAPLTMAAGSFGN